MIVPMFVVPAVVTFTTKNGSEGALALEVWRLSLVLLLLGIKAFWGQYLRGCLFLAGLLAALPSTSSM